MPEEGPLDEPDVKKEILRVLDKSWESIIDSEIDGEDSKPRKIDRASNKSEEARGHSKALRRERCRHSRGRNEADPRHLHHQGRGADGKSAEDVPCHGEGYKGHTHKNRRPAPQYAHHGLSDPGETAGQVSGDHGDLCPHCAPARHAAGQMGARGSLPAVFGSPGLQGDHRRSERPHAGTGSIHGRHEGENPRPP